MKISEAIKNHDNVINALTGLISDAHKNSASRSEAGVMSQGPISYLNAAALIISNSENAKNALAIWGDIELDEDDIDDMADQHAENLHDMNPACVIAYETDAAYKMLSGAYAYCSAIASLSGE